MSVKYENGNKYTGGFVRQGFGTLISPDGTVFKGSWENNWK